MFGAATPACRSCSASTTAAADGRSATKQNHHRHRAGSIRRNCQRRLNVDGDLRISRIVDMPDQLLGDDRDLAIHAVGGAGYRPRYFRVNLGHTAVNLAVKILDDLGAGADSTTSSPRSPFLPFFNTRGSGGTGNGFAFDSS